MTKNPNGSGVTFFGAVSKNCRTVIVDRCKKTVKKKILDRNLAKHNVALFQCQYAGNQTIEKRPIERPGFKLTHQHHIALTEAAFSFISQNGDLNGVLKS